VLRIIATLPHHVAARRSSSAYQKSGLESPFRCPAGSTVAVPVTGRRAKRQ
jgi:hypothetical protein